MASLRSRKSPRIMVVDDQSWMGEMFELLIQQAIREVTILRFQNRDSAWQELQRTDPDLLITDMNNNDEPESREYMGMSGWELLPRLADRAVKYPILVASGSFEMSGVESRARQLVGANLKVSFMAKPFSMEFFLAEVVRLLKGNQDCGRRFSAGGL